MNSQLNAEFSFKRFATASTADIVKIREDRQEAKTICMVSCRHVSVNFTLRITTPIATDVPDAACWGCSWACRSELGCQLG